MIYNIFQSSFVEVFTLSYLTRQESHLEYAHINLYFLLNRQVRQLIEIMCLYMTCFFNIYSDTTTELRNRK